MAPAVVIGIATPPQAADAARADAPLYDPGPPWAADYGLLCEVLERYGNANAHVCPVEPVTAVESPR